MVLLRGKVVVVVWAGLGGAGVHQQSCAQLLFLGR
jgi:hypothetical protein